MTSRGVDLVIEGQVDPPETSLVLSDETTEAKDAIRTDTSAAKLHEGTAITVMDPDGYVQIGDTVYFGTDFSGKRRIPGEVVSVNLTLGMTI